jgi:23S rRNA pseudouridine1911/1915/1917 synthase
VAKNDIAYRDLQAQFQARSIRKRYVALVHGWLTPERGEINAPIGRDPRQRQHMAVVPLSQGRSATTGYEIVAYCQQTPHTPEGRYTLVACHPLTGRTHQIRVHVAHIRHPIVADALYAGARKNSLNCPRQFLHAERLRLRLPATGQEMEFTVALPADLQAVLDRLQRV